MSGFSLATSSSCVTSLLFRKSFIDPVFECIQKTAQTGQFVVRVHRHLSCRFPLSIQETKAGFETGVKAAKFQTDPLPRIERRR